MTSIDISDLLSVQPSYKSPPQYTPWCTYVRKLITNTAVALAQLIEERGSKVSLPIEIYDTKELKHLKSAYAHLIAVLSMRAPALYLSRELLIALQETKLPPLPQSIEMPLNGFHLMLPNNSLAPGECCLLVHACKNVPSTDNYIPHPQFPEGCIMLHIGLVCLKRYVPFSAFITPDGSQFCIVPDLEDDYWRFGSDEAVDAWCAIQTVALELSLQTILILLFQSHLVTDERSFEVSGTGFKRKHESTTTHLPTRWLGKNYSRQAVQPALKSSHASPRAHWRKGHWHHFRHGAGRKQLKLKWIEPIFVNA